MAPQHFTILYKDVLTRSIDPHTIFADTRFETKAIVVYIEGAVKDLNAVAGIDIKAVAVYAIGRILKRRIFNGNIFAVKKVRIPERGVAGCKTLKKHV
jgi:hypothetical protein